MTFPGFITLTTVLVLTIQGCTSAYYGKEVCVLQGNMHSVNGTVYMVDDTHLFLKDFSYDGKAPDAFFYFGSTGAPSGSGNMIPQDSSNSALKRHIEEGVLLEMPGRFRVTQVKWLSVWCRSVVADLGSCNFLAGMTPPAPVTLGAIPPGNHGTSSSTVTVLNSRTIAIEGFKYNGKAPDTFFVLIKGKTAVYDSASSTKMLNEVRSKEPLRAYNGRRIEVMAPKGVSIHEYDWFSVYCITAKESFGHLPIPTSLSVPPVMQDIMPEKMYHGVDIGPLSTLNHGVSGRVFVVDYQTIFIKKFNFDGKAPDTFFYFGATGSPSASGMVIPDERGRTSKLEAYKDACLVLTMPNGYNVTDIHWFSVWCLSVVVNLGSIIFPDNVMVPEPEMIGSLTSKGHGLQGGPVTILDSRTIEIRDFSYQGGAPDTFFILGKGNTVKYTEGTSVKLPDENGGTETLSAYSSVSIEIRAPAGVNIGEYDWLSVYCVQVKENFGDIIIPHPLKVPPSKIHLRGTCNQDLPNCLVLDPDRLCVAWAVTGNDITIELRGVLEESNSYMAFGLSGDPDRTMMVGADVTVAYYDANKPAAEDYYLSARSQCSRGQGVCPDSQNDVSIVSGSRMNGMTNIRYTRRLNTGDNAGDRVIPTDREIAIVWAMGRINNIGLVTRHTIRTPALTKVNFGRSPQNTCPEGGKVTPAPTTPPTAWSPSFISGKDTKTFVFRIGPTGGRRGYEGITGQVGWGIAFYVNGLLIPEITLKRGEEYTFIIETGDDPTKTADYHPVYITNDTTGGYVNMNAQERQEVQVFAGLDEQGDPIPSAVGRACNFKETVESASNMDSFEAFFKTLVYKCDDKKEGRMKWTPKKSGLYYYQCYQHRYLGWKIHVEDEPWSTPSPPKRPRSCLSRCTAFCQNFCLLI